MRRATMILLMGTFLLALSVPVAMARADCASIFSGTNDSDTLKGDRCDNDISGLRGDDIIHGFRGADQLYGNQGGDRLYGGKGSDRLRGGNGADRLYGGPGNDRIHSGGLDGKEDLVFCGAGRDFASLAEDDHAARNCETVAVAIE